MSLVRLIGSATLSCGCVIGRYRELATNREVAYVEGKGGDCTAHGHRRNHTLRDTPAQLAASVAKAEVAAEEAAEEEAENLGV